MRVGRWQLGRRLATSEEGDWFFASIGEGYRRSGEQALLLRHRVMAPKRATSDWTSRLREGAQQAVHIRHRSPQRLIESRLDRFARFWALEQVCGQSLRKLLDAAGPMPPGMAARLAVGLCDIVAELGDSRPSWGGGNTYLSFDAVWLTTDGVLRCANPGTFVRYFDRFAAMIQPPPGEHCDCVTPEDVRGTPQGEPSSVFKLGLLLLGMLAGCPPYSIAGDYYRTLWSIVRGHGLEPLISQVPGRLADVCRKALSPRPEGRFQSAAELASSIEAASPTPLAPSSTAAESYLEHALCTHPAEVCGVPRWATRL